VFAALIFILILQRLLEMVLGGQNRRWVLARGGKDWHERRFPVIVGVHALFFLSLALEWHYGPHGWNRLWPLWLGLLLLAQLLRLWSIRSLGKFWNVRIITIPGMQPLAKGPYRFIRHPNYAAVIVEIFAIPVLCRAYFTAIIFSLANALILARRIPEEERAWEVAGGVPWRRMPRFIPRLRRDAVR
jgi:methyltransferase